MPIGAATIAIPGYMTRYCRVFSRRHLGIQTRDAAGAPEPAVLSQVE
ncbi:MAG TPA: hypothetical protein VHG28_05720 [Longimicrobiaceae bacterium]|nr:hypothetical protein [Longimicrobiaceae bacterium]